MVKLPSIPPPSVPDTLRQSVNALPDTPGCYIFRHMTGSVLYVGKSKHIKRRARSYLSGHTSKPPKIQKLVRMIHSVAHISAGTEIDALLLEYSLIKKYKPPFNSLMKQDHPPVYIHIAMAETRPGLALTAVPAEDGILLGPFTSLWKAQEALARLGRFWKVPQCLAPCFKPNGKPACLRFYLNTCMGPCQAETDGQAYKTMLTGLAFFLQGKNRAPLIQLRQAMNEASQALDFEKAAALRDQ